MGIVANAMATSTTPTTTGTTGTTATKPAATTTGTPTTAPAAQAAKPATPATAPATTAAAAANTVTGQLVAMDPTTIKVKDLKSNQEWSLNVGTANVKTYKVGDKVVCTWDGATKTLKTIEMAK
jgi:Leucine-rich repeat (LRR) protein